MVRQNLAEREAAVALDELSGKLSIQQIRDHLKARGLINIDAGEALDHAELEMARDFVQSARRYRAKTDDVQLELVHLHEYTEDGAKVDYYRKFGEVTIEEGVQLLEYCHRHQQYWDKQFQRYYRPLAKKYGRRKVQRLMPWLAIPVSA